MKKSTILTFILVLLAGFNIACAGVVLDAPPTVAMGDTYWVTVTTDNPLDFLCILGMSVPSPAVWTGRYVTIPPDSFLDVMDLGSSSPDVPFELWGISSYIILSPTDTRATGVKFEALCTGQGDVSFSLFDVDGNLIGSKITHQIPEPATLSLFALGGLAMLRKRK